jgi:hypothetical protein
MESDTVTTDEILLSILARLDQIEAKLESAGIVPAGPKPVPTGGLYDFKRPDPSEPRYGLGIKMGSPDAAEALKRAMYCVRWNGGLALAERGENEAWEEIEALKTDPTLQRKYSSMDPTFAGFCLLTGWLDPAKYDYFIGQSRRDALAGYTVERFINEQFGIDASPSGE